MRAIRPPRAGVRGLALLDATIAIAVFSLTTAGFVSFLLSSKALEEETRDRAEAVSMARELLEEVRGTTFEQVFARYNATPDDDPDGAGTAVGNRRTLLRAYRTMGSHMHAASMDMDTRQLLASSLIVEFPTDSTGTQLREDLVNPELGTPCDLNGDGVIDSLDHSADAVMLPVQVQVSFPTASGARQIRMQTVLTRR